MADIFEVYHETLQTLDQTVSELFDDYRPYTQCKKGCSGCCINGFKIRYVEAVGLLQGFINLSPDTAVKVLEQIHQPNPMTEGHCPFLVNGGCSVYDNRPALCRAFGLIVKLKEKLGCCSLNFQDMPESVPLKALDLAPYYEVLDELSQRLWEDKPLASESAVVQETSEVPVYSIRQYMQKLFTESVEENQTPAIQSLV